MAETLETLKKEIENLKKEIYEIKQIVITKPELTEETKAEIEAARKRMKRDWIPHEKVLKEFVRNV